MSILVESQYLGSISYYAELIRASSVLIDGYEHFVKSTYRNRCEIAAVNGVQALSIPIRGGKGIRKHMKEIEISNDYNWQRIHWMSLTSAYRRSPYFEFYEDVFAPFYQKKYRYLFDFNQALFYEVFKLIGLDIKIDYTSTYHSYLEEWIDCRSSFYPKHRKQENQKHEKWVYPMYNQVFSDRHAFESNLSIVDLLFNQGPCTLKYIESIYAAN